MGTLSKGVYSEGVYLQVQRWKYTPFKGVNINSDGGNINQQSQHRAFIL